MSCEIMSLEVPSTFAQACLAESMTNMQQANLNARNAHTTAMGVLQGAMARGYDELGVKESRAVSGVMATPVASPTTQS